MIVLSFLQTDGKYRRICENCKVKIYTKAIFLLPYLVIMNLILDSGNTRTKFGVFFNNQLVQDGILTEKGAHSIENLIQKYPQLTNAILCSVVKNENLYLKVSACLPTLMVSAALPLPFNLKYKTQSTLGADRIALVAGAVITYPKKNCLIMDVGTCITYDFISATGDYYGGAISPGLEMRLKAMHQNTAKLPLIPAQIPEHWLGVSTKESMLAGAFFGIIDELDGSINRYQKHYRDLTVILTGGDAQFFAKRLKNSIFANSKFLLEGCNYLLEYNKQ